MFLQRSYESQDILTVRPNKESILFNLLLSGLKLSSLK